MKIRLHEPTFGEEEINSAVEVLRSTQVTQGEKVKEFERSICNTMNYEKAVACNSGSSANLLAISALKALGRLKDGDEVIVPALSWSTTVFPIIQHGLIPVFVDCGLDTLNMQQPEITDKVKAVMPVHVYGNPCRINVDRNVLLIEDCCEAMYAGINYEAMANTYYHDFVGTHCDVATFSTYFSHHITTLEGGVVVTRDAEIDDMLRIQRSHGWTRDVKWNIDSGLDPKFTFVELGYNLRMTEVQAAIGIIQLRKLEGIVNRRRKVHKTLTESLSHISWLRLQKEIDGGRSSCFGFTMITEDSSPFSANVIRYHLEEHGIETRPIICGNMARQPVMKKYKHRCIGDLKNATKV